MYDNASFRLDLADDGKNLGDDVSRAFAKAAKWLHEKNKFTADMLSDKPVQELINATNNALQDALSRGISREVPPELQAALEQNVFIFSGFKTYHELKEASLLLRDVNGSYKPFNQYLNDIQKIDNTYNRNYLNAEYNFAVQSTQMAAKWHDFKKDGDRYLLQYRTAEDDKVRADHAALHNITLPKDDPFWSEFYPPLGWNCRCTVVQVRRDKYPLSDSNMAIAAGKAATESPKQRIFRFNPGKMMKVFPPKHPYLPKGCVGCNYKGSVNLVFDSAKAICKACRMVDAASVKWSRDRVREHFQKQLKGKNVVWEIDNGGVDKLTVSYQDVKNMTGKAHEYPYARNMSVYYLKKLLQKGIYLGSSPDIKGENTNGHKNVVKWHYIKIPFLGQTSYLEIKEYADGVKSPHHIQDSKHFDEGKIKNKVK